MKFVVSVLALLAFAKAEETVAEETLLSNLVD